MLFDTVEDIVINAKTANDYDSLRLNALGTLLGLDYEITHEAFLTKWDQDKLVSSSELDDHHARTNAWLWR